MKNMKPHKEKKDRGQKKEKKTTMITRSLARIVVLEEFSTRRPSGILLQHLRAMFSMLLVGNQSMANC